MTWYAKFHSKEITTNPVQLPCRQAETNKLLTGVFRRSRRNVQRF